MSHAKCIVCLQKSTEVPPEFCQFSNQLFVKFLNTVSANGFDFDNRISFLFCRHCRVYLTKFAELNDKLESLAGDHRRLEAQLNVTISKIGFLQNQVLEDHNDSEDQLGNSWNDQEKENGEIVSTVTELVQPNAPGTAEVEIVDANEVVDSDSDQPNSNNGEKNNEIAGSASPSTEEQDVSKFKDQSVSERPTSEKYSKKVQQVSKNQFIYKGKYPFERTDTGFKCGTCSTSTIFSFCKVKRRPVWFNIVYHMRQRHGDSAPTRKVQVQQKCIEIAPGRFQYGNYVFEKSDDKWRCLTCDHLVTVGQGKYKFKYISFHLNTKHENPGKHHMCEQCGTQYQSSQALKYHKITEHAPSNGSYPCSSCGKTFKTQIRADLHESKIHEGRFYNHVCEICGKRFLRKADLQGHIGFVHKGQKIFECKDCGKAYATKASLFVHLNSHTGKRKYACDICGMNFAQSCFIKRHKMTAHKD